MPVQEILTGGVAGHYLVPLTFLKWLKTTHTRSNSYDSIKTVELHSKKMTHPRI